MTIPAWLETGLFGGLLALLVLTALVRERLFLFLCGFLAPLMVPRLALGIGLDWYKIVGPVALALYLLRRTPGRVAGVTRPFGVFLAWAIVVSVIWMILEYTTLHRYRFAAAMGLGAGQSTYKMPVQLGSFLMMSSALFILPVRARSVRDVLAGFHGYVAGCLASSAVGLTLLLTIGRGTITSREDAISFEAGAVDLVRIGGLSAEPKYLGATLSIAVVLSLAASLFGDRATYARYWKISLVALVCVFLTYSTSAWVAVLVSVSVLLLLSVVSWQRSRHAVAIRLGIAFVVGVVSLQGFYGGANVVEAIVEERFSERLVGEEAEVDRQKDMYILDAYRDAPRHAIWGFGLGGADLEVIPYVSFEELLYERTPTAGVKGMRFFGDLGAVGLLLLLGVVLVWTRRAFRAGDRLAGTFLLAGLAATMVTGMISWTGYLFVAGGMLTLVELRRRAAAESRDAVARPPAAPGVARPAPSRTLALRRQP